MRTVAILFGGRSNEREISIITGMFAVNLLRADGWRVLPVYLDEEDNFFLADGARGVEDFKRGAKQKLLPVAFEKGAMMRKKGRKKLFSVDCALNCCHGGRGENGSLAALLEWAKIPFASPDTAISALSMNKGWAKLVARGLNIPVLPSFTVKEGEDARKRAEELGYPLVVKPSELGSSIGISVSRNEEELRNALSLAFRLDKSALVEKYLKNKRDLNCAAVRLGEGVRISPVEEVFSANDFLTFTEKYEGDKVERRSELPANLPAEIAERVAEYTQAIYEAFSCRGVVRADFLYADGALYFNELNTVPGSLALYLFGESLTCAKETLRAILEECLAHKREEKPLVCSGILERPLFGGGKGCKRRKNRV